MRNWAYWLNEKAKPKSPTARYGIVPIFETKAQKQSSVVEKNTEVVYNLRMVQLHLNYIFAH